MSDFRPPHLLSLHPFWWSFLLPPPPSAVVLSSVFWVTGVRRGSVPVRLVFLFPSCFCYGPVFVRSALFPQIRNSSRSVSVCNVGFVLFLFDLLLFCSRSICFHRIRFVFRSLSVLFCFCFVVFSPVVSGDDSFLFSPVMIQCFGFCGSWRLMI
jgi:hypothetical protein